ncbi:hypothetical protein [Streptomyces sp. NPDC091416]|uniref:hypothetical protein n=1 Tax=Streptomyces sp. NPDC091416 TaxID=3366003 RepID=UPI0037FF75D8
MSNDVLKSRARVRMQYTNEPYATARAELVAVDADAPLIPPAATADQMLFEAQVFARWLRAFGGIVPVSLSAAGRFGLLHVTPRSHELGVRVDPKALTDLLAALVRHDSQSQASYGVPGLRFRLERQRLVLLQPGSEGRIILSGVPQPVWEATLGSLAEGLPPMSQLLFSGTDEWVADEVDFQGEDEDQLEGSEAYLSALFRRPGLLGTDQELRLRLGHGRQEPVVDAAGRPWRPWDDDSLPVELAADQNDEAPTADVENTEETAPALGRALLQEVACAALERDENVGEFGSTARGELFALVDPARLSPDATAELREEILSVITERGGLLCEVPRYGEDGEYLRITSTPGLQPHEPFTPQEVDAAAAWLVPLDFNHDTPESLFEVPPARRMPGAEDEVLGFDSPDELWARTAGARLGQAALALLFIRSQERPPHPDETAPEAEGWPNAILLSRSGWFVNVYRMATGWIEVASRRLGAGRFRSDDVAQEVCRQLLGLASPDEEFIEASWVWVLLWMEALEDRHPPLDESRVSPPERLNDILYKRVPRRGPAAWKPVWEAVESGRLRQWRLSAEDVAWRDGPGFHVLLMHLMADVETRVEKTLKTPGRFTEKGAARVREITDRLGLKVLAADAE